MPLTAARVSPPSHVSTPPDGFVAIAIVTFAVLEVSVLPWGSTIRTIGCVTQTAFGAPPPGSAWKSRRVPVAADAVGTATRLARISANADADTSTAELPRARRVGEGFT